MALTMKRRVVLASARLTVLSMLWLVPCWTASAQTSALELRLSRTFGYSGGGEIQGSFLLSAAGSEDLDRVTFHVDEAVLETVTAPPFQARLHTGDYPLGVHRLWAVGILEDGSEAVSNEIIAEFVDPSASWEAAGRMLLPILAVLGVMIGAGAAITAVSGRRYKPGSYGSSGGAVCPRCSLPMNRHFLAPNAVVGKKLERCPHCGKWSRVSRASAEELAAAEARLLREGMPQGSDESQAEALSRQVDDSRFLE